MNIRSVATGRTPVPICNPLGNCVCCDDCAPGWRMNATRLLSGDHCGPASRFVLGARYVILAIQSERIIAIPVRLTVGRQELARALRVAIGVL